MRKGVVLAIVIENTRRQPRLPTAQLRGLLYKILQALGCPKAEVSLVCVDDAAMLELNSQWRNKAKTTDVLSFSQLEGLVLDPQGELLLGDIVISMPCASRQALARGHSLADEMARLLVHGTLHLLGHDHIHGGRQAKRMKVLERRLLDALGVTIAL
jgi:probable rRNA maturation factor